MKKPLKEMLQKIGGGYLLNEAGIEKSYKVIMKLEKQIDGLQKIFNREKRGMTRDRARSMEKSIKNLIMAWNRLYADTQER